MKFSVHVGTPGNKMIEGKCCMSVRLDDLPMSSRYWNPRKNSLEDNASECWFPDNQLRQMKMDFVDKVLTPFIQQICGD